MSDEYEYKPPHGGSPALPEWDVEVPWGSETIRKRVSAEDKRKALNKVAMQISRNVNLIPSKVFMRINQEKRYKVTPVRSSFLGRAIAVKSSVESDLERIERLPYVESVYLHEKRGNACIYRAELVLGNTLAEAREVTGYIQNLFGARLLSSGQTEVRKDDGTKRSVIEARVALLELVPVKEQK